jgi:hypothetical protein
LTSSISEVTLETKKLKHGVVAVDKEGQEDDTEYKHAVSKVALKKSGEECALDLMGAQYGLFEPIMPWSEYAASLVERI